MRLTQFRVHGGVHRQAVRRIEFPIAHRTGHGVAGVQCHVRFFVRLC